LSVREKEIERESEREIKTKMCRMGGIGFLKSGERTATSLHERYSL